MATKKTKAAEQQVSENLPFEKEEIQASRNVADPKEVLPQWNDRTNAEKEQSIKAYTVQMIGAAIKNAKEKGQQTFWNKDMSVEQIDKSMPFNASTGMPYNNENALILRAASELNGYEKPEFLTMRQANLLGGTLKKELDAKGNTIPNERTGNDKLVRGVKISYLKTEDFVVKKDAQGKDIMETAFNKDGKVKLDEHGQPLQKPVKVRVELNPPILETTTLYHVSQFDNLDKSKLKPLNMEKVQDKRKYFEQNPERVKSPKINEYGLTPSVRRSLSNFIKAEATGKDYKVYQAKEYNREATRNNSVQR